MERVEEEPTAIEQGTQADDLRFQLEALYGALRQAAASEEPTLERAAPAVPSGCSAGVFACGSRGAIR